VPELEVTGVIDTANTTDASRPSAMGSLRR
jgi:hypothetical protein